MSARRLSHRSLPKRWIEKLDPRHKKEKFVSLSNEIREALRSSMCPPGDPARQFVPEDALKAVWLHRGEGRSGSRLDSFHQQLTTLERDPGITENYLRLLSVLVWISFPYEGWREFANTFADFSISERQGWQDDRFPLPDSKPLHSLFESQIDFDKHEANFLTDQYRFSPAQIQELKPSDCDNEVTRLPGSTRLPFPDPEKTLHHGTHKVTKRRVAKGGIVTPIGEPPLEVVAVKTFSPEQNGRFKNELWNLKQIKKGFPVHQNIQSCFSAVQIGATGHLIFEAAECNLSQILHWQNNFSTTFCADIRRDLKPSYLLWEAKDLSDALHWLHSGFGPRNSSDRFKCVHLDLKPDNILVFPSTSSDLQDDIWMWKIADFGGSAVEHMGDIGWIVSGSGVSANGNHLRTGVYSAPEIESKRYPAGTATDIWSFGCILLEILAFAHEGPGGVKDLERVRNSNTNNSHYYDSTFNLRRDIRTWIDSRDIDVTLRGFRDHIYLLLEENPMRRPNAQDLKRPLDIYWNHVSAGTNDLIFPTPSEAPTSEQATDIEMPTNDPTLIRINESPRKTDARPVSRMIQRTPSKCRVSCSGLSAIIQAKPNSERCGPVFHLFPWNDTSVQQCRPLLSEEESQIYKVEKIAAEGAFYAVLLRTKNDRTQILLGGKDQRIFIDADPGCELSLSKQGDCIFHNETRLHIYAKGSNSTREIVLPHALKKACFSNDGKWIYVWLRSREKGYDYWQVYQASSADLSPFLEKSCSFTPYPTTYSRDLLVPLRDPSDENCIRPLFLTIDKHGNANALISDGHNFYPHAIQGAYNGYIGGSGTEDGRSILLVHQSQSNRTPDLHLIDLDPEKLRSTDRQDNLALRHDELASPYLKDYVIDTGFSVCSEQSEEGKEVYACFAVKRKSEMILNKVHVGYIE